jgi:hypothetical protein
MEEGEIGRQQEKNSMMRRHGDRERQKIRRTRNTVTDTRFVAPSFIGGVKGWRNNAKAEITSLRKI